MSTTTEKKVAVTPFVIEARTPRNQDLLIQCLDGLRLRGAVNATIEVFDKQWEGENPGEEVETIPSPAKIVPGIGELPGEQLYVNPATGEWKTFDPLHKKENVLERIRKAMKRQSGMSNVGERLQGVKPRKGKADQDRMKTLCRELLCFVEAKEARVVKGIAPTAEDIDELPGRYLLNWSNRSKWHQPKYEDQLDDWTKRVNQLTEGV